MRIEIVLDAPDVHDAAAVDAVRVAHEASRLVRNDLQGTRVEVVHVAVGSDIAVPRDYDDTHPVVNVEPSATVHDPSAQAPTVEEDVDYAPTPYHVDDPDEVDPQFRDRSPYTDENKPWAEQLADAGLDIHGLPLDAPPVVFADTENAPAEGTVEPEPVEE